MVTSPLKMIPGGYVLLPDSVYSGVLAVPQTPAGGIIGGRSQGVLLEKWFIEIGS